MTAVATLTPAVSYRVGSLTPQARLLDTDPYTIGAETSPSLDARAQRLHLVGDRSPTRRWFRDHPFCKELQPGNWLQIPVEGRFTLVLRLYDIPGAGRDEP